MISWDWFTHYDTSLWLIIQHCFIAFLCFFFSNKSWAYLFVLYSPLLFILETFNFSIIVFPHGPRFHISAFNEHPNLLSTRGLHYYYLKLLFFRLFLAVFLQHKLLLSDVSSVFALPSLALIGIHSVSPDELFDYSVFSTWVLSINTWVGSFVPPTSWSRLTSWHLSCTLCCLVIIHLYNMFLHRKNADYWGRIRVDILIVCVIAKMFLLTKSWL